MSWLKSSNVLLCKYKKEILENCTHLSNISGFSTAMSCGGKNKNTSKIAKFDQIIFFGNPLSYIYLNGWTRAQTNDICC